MSLACDEQYNSFVNVVTQTEYQSCTSILASCLHLFQKYSENVLTRLVQQDDVLNFDRSTLNIYSFLTGWLTCHFPVTGHSQVNVAIVWLIHLIMPIIALFWGSYTEDTSLKEYLTFHSWQWPSNLASVVAQHDCWSCTTSWTISNFCSNRNVLWSWPSFGDLPSNP